MLRKLIIAGLATTLTACAISTPYREIRPAPTAVGETVVVAVTEATLQSDQSARSRFWSGVWQIEAALPAQPGLLGYSLRREILGNKAWTLTVWRSREDIGRFASSELHRNAVREGKAALLAMRSAQFTTDASKGRPSWDDALEQLDRRADY